jgi:hypothetical protein
MPPAHSGTFQPLQHRSGTLRDRLHSYTKSTLGAGGSINEAVSIVRYKDVIESWVPVCHKKMVITYL